MTSHRMRYKIGLTEYNVAIKDIDASGNGGGIPVGCIVPFASNGNLPSGFLLCDGSAVSREMYPDLFAAIGTLYGEGDGETTFNLPDLGFIDSESKYPVVFGNTYVNSWNGSTIDLAYSSTATKSKQASLLADSGGVTFAGSSDKVSFDSSTLDGFDYTRSVTGYSRVSPLYADLSSNSSTVKYIIKAFNGMNTHGALLDLTGMANELNRKYDARTDFTLIYPNGGTAENLVNISPNSRYVMDNPFPGYAVRCVLEVLYDNKWGEPGDMYYHSSNGAYGSCAGQLDDNSIVVQTGAACPFLPSSSMCLNVFGSSNASGVMSIPARVKVWKIGKL